MIFIDLQLPDELGEAIVKDAQAKGLSVPDYILFGLARGIWDGYGAYHCEKLLGDYLNRER